ncbi:TonB-dependent siderophore receptor [Marinomonas sp. C2222]|uniref:TonB-dependent siderophore receptor n=1 Tax=Marinomonas sargassi TaxID=2984494 RepID=A0ABT2YNW1_9GAMM|nr:TonB-dependent siderophore receptor [Marinomonas sargassi]MCV2401575.1 TonB-dependent siderophore receptor [Marinomonas sargassi]
MNSRFVLSSIAIAVSLSINALYAEEAGTTSQQLDTLKVEGSQEESAVGPDFSYVGEVSRTATKTDVPLVETPQAVSVVTREQMDDREIISIADALKYTPSIQANFYGEDNKQDWFIIRGFKQANNGLYQDGTRLYSSGFYSWQIDPYALERVEIARGPTSTLNGQMPPGGVINLISKRAQLEEDTGQVSVKIGSYDRKEVDFDVNKAISDDMAVRVVGLVRENGTQVDGLEAERTFIAPSLTWALSDETNLTLLASYQNDDSDPYLQFLPLTGTLDEASYGYISDSTSLADLIGYSDWETYQREQTSVGYELEHAFSDNLTFAQSARFSHMDIKLRQFYYYAAASNLNAFYSGDNQALIGASVNDGSSNAFNIDNRFIFTPDTHHTVLAGVDYQFLDIKDTTYDGDVLASTTSVATGAVFDLSTSNSFDDIYFFSATTQSLLTDDDLETTNTENKQLGFYLQDQITVTDNLSLHAGIRYDDTETTIHNTSTNAKTEVENGELTSSLGASYKLGNGFVPYARYAESFTPSIAFDADGNQAEPEYASLYEAGIKFQPTSFDGYVALAAYQLTRENVAQGTSGSSSFKQVGEVRNIGAELEAVVNLNRSLTVIGNLSVVDSEITDDTTSSIIGNTPVQVAENLASLWANYKFLGGSLNNLTLGAGLRHVGESYTSNTNSDTVPSFTLLDASASYRWNDYKFQLTAKNVLDKEYVATCSSDTTCFYGDRRNVIASMTYDW